MSLQDQLAIIGVQILSARREQARIGELETAVRAFIAQTPERPGWRAVLAILLGDTSRPGVAAEEIERLAAHGFSDIPRDGDWLITVRLLGDAIVAAARSQ